MADVEKDFSGTQNHPQRYKSESSNLVCRPILTRVSNHGELAAAFDLMPTAIAVRRNLQHANVILSDAIFLVTSKRPLRKPKSRPLAVAQILGHLCFEEYNWDGRYDDVRQ